MINSVIGWCKASFKLLTADLVVVKHELTYDRKILTAYMFYFTEKTGAVNALMLHFCHRDLVKWLINLMQLIVTL